MFFENRELKKQAQRLEDAHRKTEARVAELLEQIKKSHEAHHAKEEEAESKIRMLAERLEWTAVAPLPEPSRYIEYGIEQLPPDDFRFTFFAKLVCGTCASHRKDLRSADFAPAPKLAVQRVDIVMNPRLIKSYHTKMEDIEGLRRQDCGPIPAIEHLKISARSGSARLGSDLNEHFLFHGVCADVVEGICKGGFDPRRGGSGVGKMFGVATYFAANASKSDMYTEPLSQRLPKQASRKIIVARVLLGESFRTTRAMQDATRPPDGANGESLDSVWAEVRQNGGAVDHFEAMVYDKGQAYPQAIVTYAHERRCACAQCLQRP